MYSYTARVNDQISIGFTIAIPIFSFILIIVMITAAIFYWFKKSLSNMRRILKQSLMSCPRTVIIILCCKKRVRAEPLYDVPDYYVAPHQPPRNRNETPMTTCGTTSHDEIQGDNENLDEVLRDPSTVPNIDPHDVNMNQCTVYESDSEVAFDESRVPEIIQENISYLPSTSVSHFAANPAYGTNIAIAPEILTEQNEAYKSKQKPIEKTNSNTNIHY